MNFDCFKSVGFFQIDDKGSFVYEFIIDEKDLSIYQKFNINIECKVNEGKNLTVYSLNKITIDDYVILDINTIPDEQRYMIDGILANNINKFIEKKGITLTGYFLIIVKAFIMDFLIKNKIQ